MKQCSGCLLTLPLSQFGYLKASKDGRSYQCKSCIRAYNKARDPHKLWAYSTVHQHRKRGQEVLFSVSWLVEKARTTTHCPWCHTQLHWQRGRGQRYHDSPSLDRLHNETTLTEANVEIVCTRCNSAKGCSPVKDYLAWLHQDRSSM